MSSSDSPCAACKFLQRECTQECILAPYFPSDDPEKFEIVHEVFGVDNVAKLVNELSVAQREDAVKSLVYEAEARLRDPVYGCVGLMTALQHQLRRLKSDLFHAKSELTTYIGSQAMLPMIQQTQLHLGNPSSSTNNLMNVPMMGIPQPQQQHQLHEAQQLKAVVATREQEMLRVYEALQRHHHQQHQELIGFNHSGFDLGTAAGSVTATGFYQVNAAAMTPSLALGTFDKQCQIQSQHHPLQEQLLFKTQQPPQTQQQQTLLVPQHQRSGSDESTSGGLP